MSHSGAKYEPNGTPRSEEVEDIFNEKDIVLRFVGGAEQFGYSGVPNRELQSSNTVIRHTFSLLRERLFAELELAQFVLPTRRTLVMAPDYCLLGQGILILTRKYEIPVPTERQVKACNGFP